MNLAQVQIITSIVANIFAIIAALWAFNKYVRQKFKRHSFGFKFKSGTKGSKSPKPSQNSPKNQKDSEAKVNSFSTIAMEVLVVIGVLIGILGSLVNGFGFFFTIYRHFSYLPKSSLHFSF